MKNLKLSASAFLIFLIGTLIGCYGGLMQIDLTPSHPAHPQAQEVAYSPPPNPFMDRMPQMAGSGDNQKKTDEKEPHQGEMSGGQGGHSMGHSQESNTVTPSGMKPTIKQHGGHGQ